MKINKIKYLLIPMIITGLLFLIMINVSNISYTEKSYMNFSKDILENKVSEVYLTSNEKLKVKYADGKIYLIENPRSQNLKEYLLNHNIKVSESDPSSPLYGVMMAMFISSLAITIILIVKNAEVKTKAFKSVDSLDAKAVSEGSVSFNEIAGIDEIKDSVLDIVTFLKSPEKYQKYGARIPKGIILYGEPGTGKTLIAKAVAGEAGVPFFAMSGSDFVQVYVGVGASRIRQLFKKARALKKAVIFIDEIDAIGKKRDSKGGGSDEKDQTLNALLTEMSGFNEKDGIIVMAATNRLDMLDSALLRPGRFDRHIEVPLPDLDARKKIINLYLKDKPFEDINITDWAKKTAYFSGAKIESLVNESAILACKENSPYITDGHLDKAFSIVLTGYEKQNRNSIQKLDTEITAFHEAGHALISHLVLPEEKLSKITIIPSTKGAGGYTLTIPNDSLYKNKEYIKNRIMVLLGGRAAEEIIFGNEKITTGAYSDLKSSTKLASNMILQYGMGDSLGLLSGEELSSLGFNVDSTALTEIKDLVGGLYDSTKDLLNDNISKLNKLSESLMNKETLVNEEILSILEDKN